jgi:hypothetical protein
MEPNTKDTNPVGTDLVFPASSSPPPPAPELSMDQYVEFLKRGRLLGNYRELHEQALLRQPVGSRFVILD